MSADAHHRHHVREPMTPTVDTSLGACWLLQLGGLHTLISQTPQTSVVRAAVAWACGARHALRRAGAISPVQADGDPGISRSLLGR